MRKWFGARPKPTRFNVSVGRGPWPSGAPTVLDAKAGRAPRRGGQRSLLTWLVIFLIGFALLIAVRLGTTWFSRR